MPGSSFVRRNAGSGVVVSLCAWGCSSKSVRPPSPRVGDHADDRLSACVDMYVFHGHYLLPFAAVTVQCFDQCGVGS